jgi:hypothetical protein
MYDMVGPTDAAPAKKNEANFFGSLTSWPLATKQTHPPIKLVGLQKPLISCLIPIPSRLIQQPQVL